MLFLNYLKTINRQFLKAFVNTAVSVINTLFNFIILSYGISHFGKENWAKYINTQLWIFIFLFILSWGHKEYLLIKYSKTPSKITSYFTQNFVTRSSLIPLTCIIYFFFPFLEASLIVSIIIFSHINDSFQTLITYYQKFKEKLYIECFGFVTAFLLLYTSKEFDLKIILSIFLFSIFLKSIGYVFLFKTWTYKVKFTPNIIELSSSFFLLILGLSGWLNSKIDLYFVNYFLPPKYLTEYQTLISSLLLTQSLPALIISSLSKYVYRASDNVLNKIKRTLYLIALPIVGLCSFIIWLVLEHVLHLELNNFSYLLGAILPLPTFFYVLDAMILIKQKKEMYLLISNTIAILITVICFSLFIKPFLINGVLISVIISQFFILLSYRYFSSKTITNEKVT